MTIIRSLADQNFGSTTKIGPNGTLSVAQTSVLLGAPFVGSTLDSVIWDTAVANGGTVAQASGEVSLATGTTADGSAALFSQRLARYTPESSNYYAASIRLGDTGTANNTRRWGAFDANNGAFFQISGSVLSAVTRKGTTDTAVAQGSWNGVAFTLDTNSHRYEIHYTDSQVFFLIDGRIAHTATALTTAWTESMHLPARAENTNSASSTTDVALSASSVLIGRSGESSASAGFINITASGTTVLKIGPGKLRRVVINNPGTTSTLALYDNTSAAGTLIGTINTSSGPSSLGYDLDFNVGLTVVASATPGDSTVIFD